MRFGTMAAGAVIGLTALACADATAPTTSMDAVPEAAPEAP